MAPKKVQMAGTIFIWIFRIGIWESKEENSKNEGEIIKYRHFHQYQS